LGEIKLLLKEILNGQQKNWTGNYW
jgi:hypothetical protein